MIKKRNKVVAIVGMCGSGKSFLTQLFYQNGFTRLYFGGITLDEVKKRGLELNPENEQHVRESIRKEFGMAEYAYRIIPEVDKYISTSNVVLDGLYTWSEYKALRAKYEDQLVVLAIVANSSVRLGRMISRDFRSLSKEQFRNRDVAEIEHLEKGGPIAIADYYILNNSSLENVQDQFVVFMDYLSSGD